MSIPPFSNKKNWSWNLFFPIERTGPWHNSKLAPLFKHAMGEGKAGVLAWVGKSLIQALASKPLGKAGVEPAEDPSTSLSCFFFLLHPYSRTCWLNFFRCKSFGNEWHGGPIRKTAHTLEKHSARRCRQEVHAVSYPWHSRQHRCEFIKKKTSFVLFNLLTCAGKRNCIDLMKEWDDFLNVFLLQSEGMCRIPSKECTFSVDTNPKLKAKYDEGLRRIIFLLTQKSGHTDCYLLRHHWKFRIRSRKANVEYGRVYPLWSQLRLQQLRWVHRR